MRAQIIAELATAHGGDVALAEDMVRAAADAGCDFAKVQTYSLAKLHPKDPQRDWLVQSHLTEAAHERLLRVCGEVGIRFLSTPFDAESLAFLRTLGLTTFKIASSESGNNWWKPATAVSERWIVSYPWGRTPLNGAPQWCTKLTAIPLYPTPLECVRQAPLLDGWSDHTIGLIACQYALAHGAQVIEAHLALAGRSRVLPFDKSPAEFRQLRACAEQMATIHTGVSQVFRDRWSGA